MGLGGGTLSHGPTVRPSPHWRLSHTSLFSQEPPSTTHWCPHTGCGPSIFVGPPLPPPCPCVTSWEGEPPATGVPALPGPLCGADCIHSPRGWRPARLRGLLRVSQSGFQSGRRRHGLRGGRLWGSLPGKDTNLRTGRSQFVFPVRARPGLWVRSPV